ncbi:hypothetical protein [Paenibacillus chitinolyticus]
MKKRLMKKWINRYLNPLIKDIPEYPWLENGITVINGDIIPEGCRYKRGRPLSNIKKTADTLKIIMQEHADVWLIYGPVANPSGQIKIKLKTE